FIVVPVIFRGNRITPPVSECLAEGTASTRVKESKLVTAVVGSPGKLRIGAATERNCKASAKNTRFSLRAPWIENRGSKPRTLLNDRWILGSRFPGLISHRLV